MINLIEEIQQAATEAMQALYGVQVAPDSIPLQPTNREFEGELTVVVFSLVKVARQKPEAVGEALGAKLKESLPFIDSSNVIKGFLNLRFTDGFWSHMVRELVTERKDHQLPPTGQRVVVEYCGPNTNKPLHLGHIRNVVIGYSMAEILAKAGNLVHKVNIYNDRGIAICKSMVAWQQFGNGETPESSGIKGDHLIGKYYVKFEQILRHQRSLLERLYVLFMQTLTDDEHPEDEIRILSIASYVLSDLLSQDKIRDRVYKNRILNLEGYYLEELKDSFNRNFRKMGFSFQDDSRYFKIFKGLNPHSLRGYKVKRKLVSKIVEGTLNESTPIMAKARETLRKWEQDDSDTVDLWKRMNDWVYAGFEETYKKLGVDFEKHYYESETYMDGKKLVEWGLKNKKDYFTKKGDQSVWVDLKSFGLDEKVLLRGDGTSVYLTQDLGTAQARYEDYQMDKSIYVVANEQEYHFKALKATLQLLDKPFADGIYHLSYGMVDLPTGKMKSREGTTVDADDLYDEMLATAKATTQELGKLDDYENPEAKELYRILGLGALKYFLLRVNAKKRILFNPEESIEFQGDTGPFVQYTHARIRSVLRKWEDAGSPDASYAGVMDQAERDIALQLYRFPEIIVQAATEYDPSQVANYVFALAKSFNKFYSDHPIMNAEEPGLIGMRIRLAEMTARVLKEGMALLGVDVPERM